MVRILFDELNNRDKALLTWIIIFIIWLILSKKTRKSFFRLIDSCLNKKLLIPFIGSLIYTTLIIYCLFLGSFWTVSLLKESLFWLVGVAFPLFTQFMSANPKTRISAIIKKSVRWTILVEFFTNFYVFSYPVELILLPGGILILLIKWKSAEIPNGAFLKYLTNIVLGISIVVILVYCISKGIRYYREPFTTENLRSLLISPILTLSFIPYLYSIAIYSAYGELNMRIRFLTKDKLHSDSLKRRAFRIALFNLGKIRQLIDNPVLVLRSGTDEIERFLR